MTRAYVPLATLTNWLILTATNTGLPEAIATISSSPAGEVPAGGALEEAIKLVLSIVGGFFSTIILAWLKRKFPNFFTSMVSARMKRGQ